MYKQKWIYCYQYMLSREKLLGAGHYKGSYLLKTLSLYEKSTILQKEAVFKNSLNYGEMKCEK